MIVSDAFPLSVLPTMESHLLFSPKSTFYMTTASEIPLSFLAGKTDDEIEDFIESHQGKVEILKDVITLDLPEGFHKANIGGEFLVAISPMVEFFEGNCVGGTIGIKFSNDRLLSPSMSVWSKDRPYSLRGRDHLYQTAPAPNLVLECEWVEEIHRPNKALDKAQNYYFDDTFTGALDVRGAATVVEEVWVYAIHHQTLQQGEQLEIHLRGPWKYIPIFREVLLFAFQVTNGVVHSLMMKTWRASAMFGWWGFLWILAATCVRFLCFALVETVPASQEPPPEGDYTPYLMIIHRSTPNRRVYYHMTPHKLFVPPWESSMRWIQPIHTDELRLY